MPSFYVEEKTSYSISFAPKPSAGKFPISSAASPLTILAGDFFVGDFLIGEFLALPSFPFASPALEPRLRFSGVEGTDDEPSPAPAPAPSPAPLLEPPPRVSEALLTCLRRRWMRTLTATSVHSVMTGILVPVFFCRYFR